MIALGMGIGIGIFFLGYAIGAFSRRVIQDEIPISEALSQVLPKRILRAQSSRRAPRVNDERKAWEMEQRHPPDRG